MTNPAENLLNYRGLLNDRWRVVEKLQLSPNATGGNFSVGYIIVDSSGKQAFLKALDYSEALKEPNSVQALQSLTYAFDYEKQLLAKCRDNRLDHVSLSIDNGEVRTGELHPILPVPYLVFERAEGDIRSWLGLSKSFELAFCLRALHHSAIGLQQLHLLSIAHQDLKPSNVLVFGGADCRVADLGRSTVQGSTSPTDGLAVAGDRGYAPPELLYGEISSDWRVRRFACDLYHLGSLAVFFFAKTNITALWHQFLDRSFWRDRWGHGYRSVLPHVRDAHDLAFVEFEGAVPQEIRELLVVPIRELCDPDPSLRGHPKNRTELGNPYSLQRYVTRFDVIAYRAELQMRGLKV